MSCSWNYLRCKGQLFDAIIRVVIAIINPEWVLEVFRTEFIPLFVTVLLINFIQIFFDLSLDNNKIRNVFVCLREKNFSILLYKSYNLSQLVTSFPNIFFKD